MAKLSPDRSTLIWNLKQDLLDIVDEAKAAELALLERFGETDRPSRSVNIVRRSNRGNLWPSACFETEYTRN